MFYVVTRNYAAGVGGHQVDWAAGDLVELDFDDIGPLVRDGGSDLCDWGSPLTAEQAAELRRERERAAQAEADEDTDRQRQTAVREHVARWGDWTCPGAREQAMRPFGAATVGAGPHVSTDLDAARDESGGWVVACPGCLARLTGPDGTVRSSPNLPPPRKDTTSRRYRVGHRYLAEVDGQRTELVAGEVVELPAWLGEHIQRDSPGALTEET